VGPTAATVGRGGIVQEGPFSSEVAMTDTTDKIADSVSARVAAARQRFDAKMTAYSGEAARMAARGAAREAAERASKQVHERMQRARFVMQDQLAPRAASAVETAMTRSAPMRDEAMRRARLAALALREGEVPMAVATKGRRWPIAVGFLALGGAVGAAVAWVSQAGKPMQLTPYPLPSEESHRVDMTSESNPDLPA